ncbi:MAG: cadherin repeat domain-containing protein, partial [Verrucomicrobiae bacterium]|nr:cadherin repeat domain-containing protein [Verrucomicrobiae bacterium]
AGTYPAGFNGLTAALSVPNDEPPAAWERAHTLTDLTNRLHFVLAPEQVASGYSYRLRMEFPIGLTTVNGTTQPGIGIHDMVVRFRNGAGVVTQLTAQRVTQASELKVEFTAGSVAATSGANSIEIVRTGLAGSGVVGYILYDFLRLEALGVSNTAPTLAPVANRTVDALAPLAIALQATDTDVPAQTLTFSLVSGPAGLQVQPNGVLTWTPTKAQGPGVYTVTVRVTDSGTPALSDTRQFTITVNEVPEQLVRTVWQIGTDNLTTESPYAPSGEFSAENGRNDAPPGLVTRLAGDPQYNAGTNPAADDDFYFAGTYPAGFNGLTAALSVPNDEPPAAWERAHTHTDLTNRVHFILASGQVTGTLGFRLRMEFTSGGTVIGGVTQPNIGLHDMVIRFRNGAGVVTPVYSQRITQMGVVELEFAAATVQATAGANTIELVRTGPLGSGVTAWILYDYLRLEWLAPGASGAAPGLTDVSGRSRESGIGSISLASSASAAAAAAVAIPGRVRNGMATVEGLSYAVLSYDHEEPLAGNVRYVVEASRDLVRWAEAEVVVLADERRDGRRWITVQDTIPIGVTGPRYLRVRLVTREEAY